MRSKWVLYATEVVMRHSWLRRIAFRFAWRVVRTKAKEVFSAQRVESLICGVERALADAFFAAGFAIFMAERVANPPTNLRPIRH